MQVIVLSVCAISRDGTTFAPLKVAIQRPAIADWTSYRILLRCTHFLWWHSSRPDHFHSTGNNSQTHTMLLEPGDFITPNTFFDNPEMLFDYCNSLSYPAGISVITSSKAWIHHYLYSWLIYQNHVLFQCVCCCSGRSQSRWGPLVFKA